MNLKFARILILPLLLLQFSCEEVIEIDLEDAESQLVIEAKLQEGSQDFTVLISRTSSYFDSALPETVETAAVSLQDDQGNSLSIPHAGNGVYSAAVTGVAGNFYTLRVTEGENTYEAVSYLPQAVNLLGLEPQFSEATPFTDEGYLLFMRFEDPAGTDNYYRVLHRVNGVLQNAADDLQVSNDDLFDGGSARLPLFQKIFTSGDSVEVELLHFDEASYDYFNSLTDIVSQGGGPGGASAAPGNPTSNWTGGCLGYFSASSSSIQALRIP